MIDGEALFVALNLWHGLDTEQTRSLVERGYLTKGMPANTQKAYEFINQYIEKYKMPLYEAMEKSNNVYWEAMKIVGLTEHVAFEVIANQLEEEGLFSKDRYGDYKIVIENRKNDHQERKITHKKQCPYCNSTDVEDTGFAHGFGVMAKDGSLPPARNHQYQCKACEKTFRYIGD